MCFGFEICEHAVKETDTNSAQMLTISYLAYTIIKSQNQKLWLISRTRLSQRKGAIPSTWERSEKPV